MMRGIGNRLTVGTTLLFCMVFGQHTAYAQDTSAESLLREHSNEFRREIIEITDGVYMASGYGASNSAMIVGESGLIIVDTKESKSAARAVLEEFRAISELPVRAIIYTHGHVDHTSGTTEFLGDGELEIYGRAGFRDNLLPDSDLGAISFARTSRQFGFFLDSEEFINMGTAEHPIRDEEGDGYLPPTVTFGEERFEVTIEGVDVELVAAPGETADPIRNSLGFHIIQLLEKRGVSQERQVQVQVRHILVQPSAIRTPDETRELAHSLQSRIVAGEDFAGLAREHSEDAGSAMAGGDLGWTDGSEFVPEFRAASARLEAGELSEPFQSQFGWHIAQVMDRRDQDVADEARRNLAMQVLYERRFGEELQEWLQEIRDEAFVELRTGG